MPIYGDYHGDFQNSTNSSWDQIQASLKILLPSYQPIPYDNLDELSFLSDQKQKRLCAEIKEACNRICATLNEMIQEEENPDLENYNKDLNAIATSLEIQINEEIDAYLDSTTHSSTNSLKSEADNSENSYHSFITNVESGTKIQKSLTATIEIQKSPSDPKQEDEDEFDDRNIHNGFDDRSTTVAVQRPPPEPPDLESLVVGDGEPAAARSCRPEDLMDSATGIHSGAEDGAVAKRNVDNGKAELFLHFLGDDDAAVLNCGGCVRDVDEGTRPSTSVKTTTDGGLWTRWLRRFVSLTPPPLLAAVLPWNRGSEVEVQSQDAWNRTANTNGDVVDIEVVVLVRGMVVRKTASDGRSHGTTSVAEASRGLFSNLLSERDYLCTVEQQLVTVEGSKHEQRELKGVLPSSTF
ncbi:hypothetical protein PIB30_021340 [Stylosanthes scabra]|uniref:Uncharacterized protein n=1 Tax=Stylosanthes scabra TaxID=79078 RepID=A0ABU6Q8R7_9FABA|nr:hypothetical protein [Stylosanthes scabra]